MECSRPIHGWRMPSGKVVTDRLRGRGFPIADIPCGQCITCKLERSRQWAVRITHEQQMHEKACF